MASAFGMRQPRSFQRMMAACTFKKYAQIKVEVFMSEKSKSPTKAQVMSFVLPFFIGGTYYAYVGVNHISTHPHQTLDYILAVPYAYITLGTCSGIFCLCFWRMAEGFLSMIKNWIIPKNDGQTTVKMQSYQP